MIQAIKAKFIVTPGQAPIRDSAVIIKNNIIEKIIPSTELKNNYYKIKIQKYSTINLAIQPGQAIWQSRQSGNPAMKSTKHTHFFYLMINITYHRGSERKYVNTRIIIYNITCLWIYNL